MKRIRLFCAGGASTGLLANKMSECAKSKQLDYEITAHGICDYKSLGRLADCVLLGPQVGFRCKQIKEELAPIPVETIDMLAYGRMDAEKVLQQVTSMMK